MGGGEHPAGRLDCAHPGIAQRDDLPDATLVLMPVEPVAACRPDRPHEPVSALPGAQHMDADAYLGGQLADAHR